MGVTSNQEFYLTYIISCCVLPFLLLPHGKHPFKRTEVTSAEDHSSHPNTSCQPATANNLLEQLITPTQSFPLVVSSPAIHSTALVTTIMISPSYHSQAKYPSVKTNSISLPSTSQLKSTQLEPQLKSPDGDVPIPESPTIQTPFK